VEKAFGFDIMFFLKTQISLPYSRTGKHVVLKRPSFSWIGT